jgi:hypothetical protein
MRQLSHISCCAVAALWTLGMPAAARAADAPATDYDKRAAATLYTAYDGRPTSWEQMTAKSIEGLTRVEKGADGKLTYVMNFGAAQGGSDNRGYFRVTKGEDMPDAAKGGWTPHKVDAATGAEVFFKKVESNAGNYTNLAVRRKFGPVILTIAQRRPAGEAIDTGAADVCKRFAVFIDAGKKNGLFGGEVKMWLTSDPSEPQIGTGEPLPFSVADDKETEVTIRIEVRDADDKRIDNIERLTIQPQGPLAPFVKLKHKGKLLDAQRNGKFVINKPDAACTISLVIPAAKDEEIRDALLEGVDAPANEASAAGAAGLGLAVGAKFGK